MYYSCFVVPKFPFIFLVSTGPIEQADSIERLVETAMTQLQDLRYPVSIQGLLTLVNCLPTDYKHYDQLLPRWVDLWVGKNHRYAFCTAFLLESILLHLRHLERKRFNLNALFIHLNVGLDISYQMYFFILMFLMFL